MSLIGVAMSGALLGAVAPGATASPPTTSSPATSTIVAARHFTATGTLGRYYTKQTVTGTYKNAKGRPIDVTVFNWQDIAQITTAKPKLDNAWWGGYWHTTYGLDQWLIGTSGGNTYHLMLPPPPMGSTFQCLLVTEFSGGGNWQNWMEGTSQ
jgi:hypothetical protein